MGVFNHPTNEPALVLRRWQYIFCDGNSCAASVLSYLCYWHEIKSRMAEKYRQQNDTAEQHGDDRHADESMWQWHTTEQIMDGIMIYGKESVRQAIAFLEQRGVVKIGKNPNPKYSFDRTRFFLLNERMIESYLVDLPKLGDRSPKIGSPSPKIGSPSPKIGRTSTETSSETTTEITVIPPPENGDGFILEPGEEKPTASVWNRYANAYLARYGTNPVRNKKVNSQIKQFVERLGTAESPAIAEFYLQHNSPNYVRSAHGVGLMLMDAEKLRTEWATRKKITTADIKSADEHDSRKSVASEAAALLDRRRKNANRNA